MEIVLYIIFGLVFLGLCGIVAYREYKNIPRNIIPFKESVELVGVPVVTFYCGKKKLHFILDSGATGNVIDSKVLKSLGTDYYSNTGMATEHFGSEGNVVLSDIAAIKFSYSGLSFDELFTVVDMSKAFEEAKKESGVTIHGLLGSSFFKKYNYILDFDKMIFYNKK